MEMTEQFAHVGWTDRRMLRLNICEWFFDMKDGTKPEGSQLITPRGYVLPRSTLILHLVQRMWNVGSELSEQT